MPQANSITSRPRVTSPIASDSTLPCSATQELRDLLLARMHELADVEHQLGALGERDRAPRRERSFATWTAWSTSSTEARSTAPLCLPVAGLKTGLVRPEVPTTVRLRSSGGSA